MNCVIFFVDRAVVTRHVQFVCVYALFVCALFVCALFWPQIACRPRVSCARDQLRLRTRVALQSAGPVLLGRRQRPWLRLSAFVVVRCRRCAEYSCKISGVLVCVCCVCNLRVRTVHGCPTHTALELGAVHSPSCHPHRPSLRWNRSCMNTNRVIKMHLLIG